MKNVGTMGSRPVVRGASGCNALTTNLKAPIRNLHNTKHKLADHRAKKHDTSYLFWNS